MSVPNLPKHTLIYLHTNTPPFTRNLISLHRYTSTYLKLHTFTNISQFTLIYLNLLQVNLNIHQFTSNYFDLPDITSIHLNVFNAS